MSDVNCDLLSGVPQQALVCRELTKKIDTIQTQMFIVSGVGGGVALCLIIIIIALAIQFSSLRQRAANLTTGKSSSSKVVTSQSANTNQKSIPRTLDGNFGSSQNGQQHAAPHSYAQPPKTMMTAEEELAHLGFSAYKGNSAESRGLSPSAMSSTAGGVRVLPRNPPTNFRQNSGYTDNYM